ncbi:MAG TPA: glycosyltransferase [Bryobacteraceae bacterium]|nr:glycosyltransferase [Bryobacteraceae bacterium]
MKEGERTVRKLESLEAEGFDPRSLVEIAHHLTTRLDQLEDRSARSERNLAAQQALLDDRLLKVERSRIFSAFKKVAAIGSSVRARLERSFPAWLETGFKQERAAMDAYPKWLAQTEAEWPSAEQAVSAWKKWPLRPRISVLLSVRDGAGLGRVLGSLGRQIYQDWELCVAIDPHCEERVSAAIGEFAKTGASVSVIARECSGEAATLKQLLGMATGDYVSMVEETGCLSPWALHYMAEAVQSGRFDLIYCDEDALDAAGRRTRPLFKPGWSPALLESVFYIGSFVTLRREFLMDGLSRGLSSVRDLVWSLGKRQESVYHIPQVLYHQSVDEPAASGQAFAREAFRSASQELKVAAVVCSRRARQLETCLKSLRQTAGHMLGQIIVIAHEETGMNADLRDAARRNGALCESFSGRFNFATMNNLGAAIAQAPLLLFLNDDVRATQAGWLEMLAAQLAREDVGAAGAVLWYPSGTLQHAGVAVGIHDGAGHVGRHMRSSALWPWLLSTRDVTAVTGACLAIRKDLFQELGGFDAEFPINYNDVDLCLRARERGYRIVNVGAPGLIHAECQTREGVIRFQERFRFFQRWAKVLCLPDPYYSPSLAPTETITLNFDGYWAGNVSVFDPPQPRFPLPAQKPQPEGTGAPPRGPLTGSKAAR